MVINAANVHHLGTHVHWASALLAPCQVWVWGGTMENPGAHRQHPRPSSVGGTAPHGPQKTASHPLHPSEGALSLWETIPEKQSASFWDNTSNTTSPITKPQIQPHNTDVWACSPSKERLTFYTAAPTALETEHHRAIGTSPTIIRNTPAVSGTHPQKKEDWKGRPLQGAACVPLQRAGVSLGPTKALLFKQRFSLKNFAFRFGFTYMKECFKRPIR